MLYVTMYVPYITNLPVSQDSNSDRLCHNRVLQKFQYFTFQAYFPFTFDTMLRLQLKQSR